MAFLAKSFENFIYSVDNLILEASTLSKTGMPDGMVSAIHKKVEHWDNYPRMAHTYRGGEAIPMPYKYHAPSHDIEIGEPIVLRGRKTNIDPYSGREIKSQYTDFHWFIESLPLGQNRALIANPDLDFFMYIYDKSKSKGAPGLQYAIIYWDKEKGQAIDFGYSELTTRAVDRSEIRGVHDTKGGNRSDKIQEFIRSVTRDESRDYAPSRSKPLYAYKLKVDTLGVKEPRELKKTRESSPAKSIDLIRVFADKYSTILPKLKKSTLESLRLQINNTVGQYNGAQVYDEIAILAKNLDVSAKTLQYFLFLKMKIFRSEIFEEGRGRLKEGTSAYGKTSGFELELENKEASKYSWSSYLVYKVELKKFSPDEEKRSTDNQYRESQPEKYMRNLPIPGNYASIKSIISKHKLDGALSKFAWFILTDKIKFPEVSVASILGVTIKGADTSTDEPDEDNWLF